MSRNLKIRRTVSDVIDTVVGCRLVPIGNRKSHYVSVQSNVLADTFYRVTEATDTVRALVTIMPSGLRVAWDTCGKCHHHVAQCACKSGVYHPASIGWIRATCDQDSYQRITDYSMFNDPYMKLTGDETSMRDEVPTMMVASKKPSPIVPAKSKPSISASDIENMDIRVLDSLAKKQAGKSIRRANSIIRGKVPR